MCAAAIWWARIDRVFYGNLLSHAADLGIDIAGLDAEAATPTEQRGRPYRRLLGDETYAMFRAWWDSGGPHDHLMALARPSRARHIRSVVNNERR